MGDVDQGRELISFALAVLDRLPTNIAITRDELEAAAGKEAAVDAAAIIARFDALDLIADATGTRLDAMFGGPGLPSWRVLSFNGAFAAALAADMPITAAVGRAVATATAAVATPGARIIRTANNEIRRNE